MKKQVMRNLPLPFKKRQSGNVLLVCLALMMIMTLWGISSTRNVALSLQGNYNAQMKQYSFEAAEFTVRQVEQMLENEITLAEQIPDTFNGTNGRYSLALDIPQNVDLVMVPADFDYRVSQDWLESYGDEEYWKELSYIEVEYDSDPDSPTFMERQPRAIIEYLGREAKGDESRYVFRISAIAWGLQGLASSVVRTHYTLEL
ncbi:hypothetical protein ACFOEK_14180 [Litoribrevibacter euphylliae]|uniref:PilX/PilW C-terminal domain-containing protein n=1 Tax=Litoribrevibacter euphylliae TaxID=1834034 RepID=A0ABV7HHQ7_9GAMM